MVIFMLACTCSLFGFKHLCHLFQAHYTQFADCTPCLTDLQLPSCSTAMQSPVHMASCSLCFCTPSQSLSPCLYPCFLLLQHHTLYIVSVNKQACFIPKNMRVFHYEEILHVHSIRYIQQHFQGHFVLSCYATVHLQLVCGLDRQYFLQ